MRYLGKPWMSIANLLQEAGMLSWASKSGHDSWVLLDF